MFQFRDNYDLPDFITKDKIKHVVILLKLQEKILNCFMIFKNMYCRIIF